MSALKKWFKLFFIFIASIISFVAYGNSPTDSLDNIVVRNLNEDWMIYDHQYKSYLPVIKKSESTVNSISQFIDLNKYKKYNLNFIAAPNLSLFVDNRLYYKNDANGEKKVKLKIEDLLKKINQSDNVILTFYHPNGRLPHESFYVGHFASEQMYNKLESKASIILLRELNQKQNLFILTFLSIFFVFALIRNRYPRKFYEFSNFKSFVPSIEDNIVLDISSTPIFLFILINSLCASLILFLMKVGSELNFVSIVNISDHNSVLGILLVTCIFFTAYLIKYIYMKIVAWVFNLSELVKMQFYELLKVSLKVNLFMAALAFVLYSSSYFVFEFPLEYFFYTIIISLFIVMLRVGYLTFKLSGFRNIYLFSYLCATEILPLMIIVKILLF